MSEDAKIRQARRRPIFEPDAAGRVEIGRDGIERMLPHRAPMLLVDVIDFVELGAGQIRGLRRIDPSDPVLVGHFPGDPVYPGVLLLEAIGQLGICLLHLVHHQRSTPATDDRPRPVRLLKVTEATFQGAVAPGATMDLRVCALDASDYVSSCLGQVLVEGEIKAFARYDVYLP